MATKSGDMDYWRKYFRSANTDIFDVIENAIVVAASDCPKEFRNRRDRIAEKLFSCRLSRCVGCDRVELKVPEEEGDEDDDGLKTTFNGGDGDFEGGKESKVNSSTDDHVELNMTRVSNYSYDEAEALTEEIEEVTQIVGEVLRIKEILSDSQDQSDGVLFESLRRLQLMELSVETLKATEIGKAVNGLRKHASKQIRHLARTLIDGWKILVDEWVCTTAAFKDSEGSPDSVKPSEVDEEEEGLPSPPLDEGAFLAPPTSIELSQFFDGMDDFGNPRNSGEFNKNHERGRKPVSENCTVPTRKPQPPQKANVTNENKSHQMKKQEAMIEQTKTPNTNSEPARFPKQSSELKANNGMKLQQKADAFGNQKRPPSGQQDKPKSSEEVSVRMKLEAAKRKLHEGYQQAENAKKQRTIQVMELHDLPKQGLGHRNPHLRPGAGGHNRNWSNGRR
ncbi:Transcription elongation factor [Macleaya cordata]|uniref:Transcription elongation factor n=1 Tax=Macleaya cordata TaxID=56857 RepID=A0A200Q6X7_MACCD|nr:Transcription elongation factor [Macleaya cordata]